MNLYRVYYKLDNIYGTEEFQAIDETDLDAQWFTYQDTIINNGYDVERIRVKIIEEKKQGRWVEL